MTTYLASFDVENDKAFGTITLATAGKSNVVVDLTTVTDTTADGSVTTGLWNHYSIGLGQNLGQDISATETCGDVFSDITFADKLELMLEAAATTAAWASPSLINVTYTPSTNRYTIAYTGAASFSVTFSVQAGFNLLGFSNTTHTGAQTYTGENAPDYTIECTLDAVSSPTVNYEPSKISTQAVSGSASFFGLTRGCVPLYRDWVQQFEVKAKVLRLSNVGEAHPFTFQEMFERSRTDRPFVVYDGNFATNDYAAEVFVLRTEGSNWGTDMVTYAADMDGTHYHVTFKALVLGTPQEAQGG